MPSLAKQLPSQEDVDDRGSRRVRVRLDLAGDELGAAAVRLHDLSTEGLLIETDAQLQQGARVTVTLPSAGAAEAEIVWSSGRFFGGRFVEPLSPAVVRAASTESPVVWPDFPGSPPEGSARRSRAARELIETQRPLNDVRLAYGERLRVIVGGSALLWTAAAGLMWVAVV